ncbi:DUF4393 domain-containing protein [Leptospira bandrabouensis]|uniref:DUF4393 domain-containing protein n=1 Tax=Leptospira bandrabouensis TaxID=2484903 RepID=UPI001EE94924|nr:DUF4393 domain-containing protein [Leptospira bandrabouensis]MCG6146576.1 DUF4393 domain-containing protein [Leptospira bandrabouensis]MCG6161963.1 DUF4393 domain-containing protein [Leptospira bandrabouensis]MCG6166144.1 DUF4393 domain-containing protein [Leptospira bandrabouensis]
MGKSSSKIVAKEIYKDLLSPSVKEIGDILKNSTKVARFAFAGIDYLAAKHDRWKTFLEKVAGKVKEENLVEGHPQIIGPIIESMVYIENESIVGEMFSNLLARAIDKTSQDKAHPAFPKIIQQLSEDEAIILFYLKKKNYRVEQEWDLINNQVINLRTTKEEFPLTKLSFSEKIWMYMDHLNSLTIAGTWKTQNDIPIRNSAGIQTGGRVISDRKLSEFGKLFADACIPDIFEAL